MNRITAILLAALLTAAPLSQADAQDRGQRGGREQSEPRMSEAQAQSIAMRRAPSGARYVGSLGYRSGQWWFRFETESGRIIDIAV